MKPRTFAVLTAALALIPAWSLTGPAWADDAHGEVKEIIVKIQTENGPRWYVLGKNVKEINIHEGDFVEFDYADDTIDSINVKTIKPKSGEAEKTEPKE